MQKLVTHHPEVGPRLKLSVDSEAARVVVELEARGGCQLHVGGQANGHHHMVSLDLWHRHCE